jgi:hypothetical protein
MNEPTLSNSATPGNRLRARLRFISVPTPSELVARINAGCMVPWEVAGGDDEELVEPVPRPAAPRRQRKRSLAKVCEAARKAGADRVVIDGIVIMRSPAAAVPETASEWDAVLSGDDHGPN